MNKCRRYPGGPARQEGPLISSHVQSGCLTRRGAEVVMSFLPPSWKHRAHSRAGASVWPGMRKMAQTPARPTSRGDLNVAFIFDRVVKVHRETPPPPLKSFCLFRVPISQAGHRTGLLSLLSETASCRPVTEHVT